MRELVLLLIGLCYSLSSFSQDTIVFNNGKKKVVYQVFSVDSINVYYFKTENVKVSNRGTVSPKVLDRVDVFEIRYADGSKEMIYKQDKEEGFDFHPDSMRLYVNGCIDAQDNAHNHIVGPIEYAAVVGSSFVIPAAATLLVVIVYSGAMNFINADFPDDNERYKDKEISEYYKSGYTDIKRKKKVKSSLFFGIAGVASAFLYHLVLFPQKPFDLPQ